jgi:hypothetical protein
MSTLKELSAISISKSIMEAPPMIQEMVINTTKKHIEDTYTSKIESLLPFLVDQIIDHMINSINNMRSPSIDYYSLYEHIDKGIISTAIKTAKIIFEKINYINAQPQYFMIGNLVDAYDRSTDSDDHDSNRYEDDSDDEESLSSSDP